MLLPHDPFNKSLLKRAHLELSHRLEVMAAAQEYVDSLDIGRPKNFNIYQFDADEFFSKIPRRDPVVQQRRQETSLDVKIIKILFPSLYSRKPFTPYDKGIRYLEAALYSTTVKLAECTERVARLVNAVQKNTRGCQKRGERWDVRCLMKLCRVK